MANAADPPDPPLKLAIGAAVRAVAVALSALPAPAMIYKAVAFPPQDQQDIERLLVLHPAIDLVRVRRIVGEFAAALDEPDRIDRLDDIIRRTDQTSGG